MKFWTFVLMSIMVFSMIGYSYAESFEPGLTVSTNSLQYEEGDSIEISGKVSRVIRDTGISIQIWKDGNVFKIGYVVPNQEGNYSYSIIADGKEWTQGTYVVRASYGQGNIAETTYTLGKFEPIEESINSSQNSDPTIITVNTKNSEIFLDLPKQIVQADIEIQNFSPSKGKYFMKITHLPTQKILKNFEIYPKDTGLGLWTVQIAYPILESEIKSHDKTLLGEFEITVFTEYGSETGGTNFSVLESSDGFIPEMILENEQLSESDSGNNPKITEILSLSDGFQISWTQKEPIAPSFDIIIDEHDTGSTYRTSSNTQMVESGKCFIIQARYPDKDIFLESEEVCFNLESPSENNPIITEILSLSDGIQISWKQKEPIAPSFDVIIDGDDTGKKYRTSSTTQTVEFGSCFSIQARYPDEEVYFTSEEICFEPEPILEKRNPSITEILTMSNQIQVSWKQKEPIAPSFDVIIDGDDTGKKYRTSSTTQTVESGSCFSIQARYPDEDTFLTSEEVCFGPKPIPPGFDRFGTMHLYETAGRVFESHWDQGGMRILHGQERDSIDPELKLSGRNPELVIDGKGIATMQGEIKNEIANPRMFVYDETGEKKWKNTEITIYMMRVSEHESYSYSGLNVNSRSEHQDASEDPANGQSYTGRFIHDGRTMFVKEIIHGEWYENADKRIYPWSTSNKKMPYNQWIGLKLVTYDLPNGNVKLELYMDLTDGKNGGDWELTNQFIDNGTWASRIFSEPATSVWIKNDGLGVAKYKNFSVREIIPPQ